MTPAALRATFSDLRLVKGRKVAQLIFEMPLEQADEAVRLLGGLPRPDREVWVAIARLTGSPERRPADPPPAGEEHTVPPPTKRKWSEMRPSERAALLCRDGQFQMWLLQVRKVSLDNPNAPRDWMLKRYGITSRSQLDDLPHARVAFADDEHAFFTWRDEQRWGPNPGAMVGA